MWVRGRASTWVQGGGGGVNALQGLRVFVDIVQRCVGGCLTRCAAIPPTAGGQGKEECDSVRVVITPTVDGAGVQLRLEVRQDAGAGASSPRGGGDQDGGDADGDEGDSSSSSSSSGGVSNGGGLAGASPHSSSASNVSGGAGTRGGGGAAGQGRSPPGSPFAARASELRVEVTAVEVEAVLEPGGGAVGVVAPSAVPQVA